MGVVPSHDSLRSPPLPLLRGRAGVGVLLPLPLWERARVRGNLPPPPSPPRRPPRPHSFRERNQPVTEHPDPVPDRPSQRRLHAPPLRLNANRLAQPIEEPGEAVGQRVCGGQNHEHIKNTSRAPMQGKFSPAVEITPSAPDSKVRARVLNHRVEPHDDDDPLALVRLVMRGLDPRIQARAPQSDELRNHDTRSPLQLQNVAWPT